MKDIRDFRYRETRIYGQGSKIYYLARDFNKEEYRKIVELLSDNDWKLKVDTLYNGHYVGAGTSWYGPYNTKAMCKIVNKLCKERHK